MKFSIVIPIYNVERYVEQCLTSILEQSYRGLEIILVNDGTKDNSMKVIEHYLSDSRIKVINKENGGLSSARNIGLEIATGDYVAFIDSDDWIRVDKLMELYNIIQNEKLDFIIGNGEYYPSKEKIHKKNYLGVKTGIELFEEMLEEKDYLETVWRCIYSRKFLQENNLKFIEGLLHEDTPFMFECLIKASKVKYENINFYFYRKREDSIVATKTNLNLYHILYGINLALRLYQKTPKKSKKLNMYLLNMCYKIFKELKIKDINLIFKLIKLRKFTIKGYIKLILLLGIKYKKMDINNIKLNGENNEKNKN